MWNILFSITNFKKKSLEVPSWLGQISFINVWRLKVSDN